jgi:hypothetical protein
MTAAQPNFFDLLAPVSPPAPGSDGGVEGHANAGERRSEEMVLGNHPAVPHTDLDRREANTETGRGSGVGVETHPSETSIHWILITTTKARTACGIAMPAYYDKLGCGYSDKGQRLSGTHNRDDGSVTCERCLEEMR